MSFGTRHLLLGLLLAATAGAEPTTQPDAPPVIRGEVIGTAFRAEEVNLAVRSVRHQLVYEIVDGELTPAEQGPVPAKLHCEVSLPPLLTQMATYRSELTALEDDSAEDMLKPFRTPQGKADIGIAAGSVANSGHPGPVMVDVPLPVFPRAPRTVGRIAGLFTLYVPAETRSFDIPLDKIGATAVTSDVASLTLVSCSVRENNRVFEVKLKIKAPDGAARASLTALGLGAVPAEGRSRQEYSAMGDLSWTGDTLTVQFAPGRDRLVKTLRLFITTKTLEVPLQYDIRTRPMM